VGYGEGKRCLARFTSTLPCLGAWVSHNVVADAGDATFGRLVPRLLGLGTMRREPNKVARLLILLSRSTIDLVRIW
jgi:hypothetical protein